MYRDGDSVFYDGYFLDNHYHGYGVWYDEKGKKKYSGQWENG